MRVVDANVLLYAVNPATEHHTASLAWLDRALDGEDNVGFTWNALLAFVRISTNPRIMPSPADPAAAMAQVHDWLAAPSAHVLNPGARHPEILERLLVTRGVAANLVNDAHLAAMAIEHHATIVSYDSDFDLFEGVRVNRPDDLLRNHRQR
ncbi:PIN domain-containing protein [Microbacterium protaetiae]|uniref:Ribonuclease VapC n=1 Tax=Microbacterium protaetiae TaxID=2509458 RepID=A0A4P6EK46_9MICO|nr:type II toxin-antitoxin system VapC family toxin [Microbacterium protaetiae]QAY60507.1 PIN domain-containing protein [Microbacterium protaetiae]